MTKERARSTCSSVICAIASSRAGVRSASTRTRSTEPTATATGRPPCAVSVTGPPSVETRNAAPGPAVDRA